MGKNLKFPIFFMTFYLLLLLFSLSLHLKTKLLNNYNHGDMATKNLKLRTQQLVSDFCSGNDHAFAELYDMYVQMLFNYGMKLTSDQELLRDCIHDVFVKVYSKRNERNAINNLCSYLIISLKNRLLDEFRRQAFSTPNEVEEYEYRRAAEDVERDYICLERELLQSAQVAHLMQNLTRRQRQAITLYYLEERKYDEICVIMKMNYHSVRNLMHRGMLKLRQAAHC